MKSDGSCDLSILENVLQEIDLIVDNYETKRTIVVKSTIIHRSTTKKWNDKFESLSIVFNPEFLQKESSTRL